MKLILLLFLLISVPSALSETIVPYPPRTQSTQQFYTVTFDGEGEALVTLKIVIPKHEDALTVEVPGRNIRILNAIQETKSLQTNCVEYNNQCVAGRERVCVQWDPVEYYSPGVRHIPQCLKYETVDNPCIRQEQVCMRSQQTYGWPYTYHPLTYTTEALSRSTLFTFTPVKSDSTTILLSYKVGTAKKSLGIWYANFETAKIAQDTDGVRVALNVIPEFHLKGAASFVDYNPGLLAEMKMTSAMESSQLS